MGGKESVRKEPITEDPGHLSDQGNVTWSQAKRVRLVGELDPLSKS
jgi:hypothetical protein